MVDRAGQAFAWPVPSDAGISTPVRFATITESKRHWWLLSLSEEHKECATLFTQELRLGLLVLFTSVLEVCHG